MKNVIGKVTTYLGTEHPYLTGYKVRIVAVMKNSMKPGIELDDPDYDYIRDDAALEQAGGVTVFDRLDVQPWLEKEGRFSFVTSDSKATDLAIFKRLAR
jgi:hypothetical protein